MKYSNSNAPLICMLSTSTCYTRTTTMEVKGVLWHSTGANNPNLSRYVQPADNDPNRKELIDILGKNTNNNDWNHIYNPAGLNCWIGKLKNGTIETVQTMPWDYQPWGCGNGSKGTCNDGWIQFEICEDNLLDSSYFNKVYIEACEITAYLCKMFNIDPTGIVNYKGIYVPTILCHQDAYKLGLGTDHKDIYHWFSKFNKNMETIRKEVKALCSGSASISVASVSSSLSKSTFSFVPRLTRPEAGNKYYITKSRGGYSTAIQGKPVDKDCDVLANCVGYAYGRFNEIGNYGECKYLSPTNAENFIESRGSLEFGQEPKLGACMVWQKGPTLGGGDGAGHVAIVEQIISSTEIVTSESGWNSNPFWTKTRIKGDGNWGAGEAYKFRGFIYNPAVTDDTAYGENFDYSSDYSGDNYFHQITFADLGIDESQIQPFIVAVDPNTTDVDYDKLKELKVCGMMFFAGQKFTDSTHLPRDVFRATNLRKQVEDCQEAGLVFALYTKVLARNVDEAKEEIRQLYYTVSRYPPGMGIWLSLRFRVGQSKTTNHQILDTYYTKLSEYGLMRGCGLYVTPDELNQIDWDQYKDKFQLWIRDYCDTLDEAKSIDILVEPTFFKLDSTGGESI